MGVHMARAIAVLNAGSSSLKFSVFLDGGQLQPLFRGQLEGLFTAAALPGPRPRRGNVVGEKDWPDGTRLGHDGAIEFLFTWAPRRGEAGRAAHRRGRATASATAG